MKCRIAVPIVAAAGGAWAANVDTLFACLVALTFASFGISACKPALWAMPPMSHGGAVGPSVIGQLRETTGSYVCTLQRAPHPIGGPHTDHEHLRHRRSGEAETTT